MVRFNDIDEYVEWLKSVGYEPLNRRPDCLAYIKSVVPIRLMYYPSSPSSGYSGTKREPYVNLMRDIKGVYFLIHDWTYFDLIPSREIRFYIKYHSHYRWWCGIMDFCRELFSPTIEE